MIAAIYARKSNEQTGVSEDAKSVRRQIDHAKAYAEKKGWMVIDKHIYVDDGVSGAEFLKRPGFLKLMEALKPKPLFQVLVMSEESRLGRNRVQTEYSLALIADAGVKIYYYLEDREARVDDATSSFIEGVRLYASQMEREKAAQRTYDALRRKAERGEVCGGLVYGYDNVPLYTDASRQKRASVKHVINETEAPVVRRIFRLCAAGKSLKAIAKILNDEGVPPPRPRRPDTVRINPTWAPSAVRHILYNDRYRGLKIWNKTRRIPTATGVGKLIKVPETEWIKVHDPELAIVTDEEWRAAHDRLRATRENYVRINGGRLFGRPGNGLESKYLLVGLSLCGRCGGSLYVRRRFLKGEHRYTYGCTTFKDRGAKGCPNSLEIPMSETDQVVLSTLAQQVLHPGIITKAIRHAVNLARLSDSERAVKRETLLDEIARLEKERTHFLQAIALGGDLPSFVAEVSNRDARLAQLQHELADLDQQAALTDLDLKRMERELTDNPIFKDWKKMLAGHISQARQLLRALLVGRLRFTPKSVGPVRGYEFTGQAFIGKLLTGLVLPGTVVSPTGFIRFR